MKTFKQWLRTKKAKAFIAKYDPSVVVAMQAAWEAGQDALGDELNEEYESHEDWCQTHYACDCGADQRSGRV